MIRPLHIINKTITALFASFFFGLGALLVGSMTYGYLTTTLPRTERMLIATAAIDLLGLLLLGYGGVLFWFLRNGKPQGAPNKAL